MSIDRPQLKEVSAGLSASLAEHARRPLAASPNGEGLSGEALKDLERIREILYGSEKRDSSRRFEQMEKQLETFATRMDMEIQRRMEEFEGQIKEEVRGLAAEVRAEQKRQGEMVEVLLREFQGAVEQVEQKLETLVGRAGASERELRDLLGLQVQSLTELMRHNHDEINATLAAAVGELRDESVDWPGLAGALRDVAKQVSTRRSSQDVPAAETE